MIRLATLLLLMFQAPAPQDVRPGEVLDLNQRVRLVPAALRSYWVRGAPPLGPDRREKALPLRVRIVLRAPEGRQSFSLTDTLTCDVELANLGERPFTIPWSSDENLRPETLQEADVAGYQEGRVTFQLLDKSGRGWTVGGGTVGSLPSLPASSRSILPGEAVAIRASFPLGPQEYALPYLWGGLPPATTIDTRLVANFFFYPYGSSSSFSENSIPIKLTGPRVAVPLPPR